MKKQLLLIVFFLTGIYHTSFSQSNLFIDTTFTIEEMVMDFFDDPNIIVSNVTSITSGINSGFFDAGGTDLGLDAGIVLSTGNIFDLAGAAPGTVTTSLGLPGDSDIDAMGGSISNDAVLLEFDFTVSMTDTLHFNYVFGSEEYPEWVGTNFNDAFAFLISGPGINGPFSNNAENIALIPNSMDEVAINSVNAMMNSNFFVDNENGTHIALDGFTVPLPSSFFAVAGETYHIKLVISDRADASFDSGVFLSFNSLNQDSLLSPPSSFQFSVNPNTNAVEFVNDSKYARAWQWDFGNNQTSNERYPGVINYSAPGDYLVTLTTQNYCCSEVFTSMVTIGMAPLGANVTTTNISCAGENDGAISLEIIGGTPPYDVTWSNGAITPTITNISEGSYSYTIVDADGVEFSDIVVVNTPEPIILDGVNYTLPSGGQTNGSISLIVSGGTPPYSYSWPNGGPDNIPNGTYLVIITDSNGCTEEFEFTLNAILEAGYTVSNVTCFGGSDGAINLTVLGGVPPYSYNTSPAIPDFENLSAGNYDITVTDATGQTILLEIPITEPPLIEVTTTSNPATGANADGSATADATGGIPPYSYYWSNGTAGNQVNNLTAGEYTVEVKDADGCIQERTVVIESLTSINDNNDLAIKLFPNPVIDQLQIEWSEGNVIEKVFIVNFLGQTVPSNYELNGNRVNIYFDKNWIKGTYFLQLHFEDGKKATARFVLEGE